MRRRRRAVLDRVCRDAMRPPVAIERLRLAGDGDVRLSSRRAGSDGTTDLIFTPMALLERLAVLVPRPRINLVLYFGVSSGDRRHERRLARLGRVPACCRTCSSKPARRFSVSSSCPSDSAG